MIPESFLGLDEHFTGLKCVICGEVIDPTILKNRGLMKDGHVILPRGRAAALKYIDAKKWIQEDGTVWIDI